MLLHRLFLFIAFLFLTTIGGAQSLLSQRVSLAVKSLPLIEVLETLQEEYNVRFAYSREKLALNQPVTISCLHAPLDSVLTEIFDPSQVIYKEIGQQIILRKNRQKLTSLKSPNPKKIMVAPRKLLEQTIRGKIIDRDSKMPLVGASVWMEIDGEIRGVTSDQKGYFKFLQVPIGRQIITASYIGFQPEKVDNVLVISGKETVLSIELGEFSNNLNEVIVKANDDASKPLNEMSISSSRSFTIDETNRYAASMMDPARMVLNYAGVASGATGDGENLISVRGNSPTANLWRLEGIDIPNPNHYATLGSGGGAISMLSTSTLGASDFLTGAYPAGYGNAIGGIFDLRLRSGNTEKREYAISVGSLGLEASAEGPLKQYPGASYLINYRFSTLALLNALNINPTGVLDAPPFFQDVSFKVQVPTGKYGQFCLFGVGGYNSYSRTPDPDTTTWNNLRDRTGWKEEGKMATIGLTHHLTLTDQSYLHSALAFSHVDYLDDNYIFDNNIIRQQSNIQDFQNNRYSVNTNYHNKFDAANTIRAGVSFSHRFFGYNYQDGLIEQEPGQPLGALKAFGYANMVQAYFQWKFKMHKQLTLNLGVHASYFGITKSLVPEPRFSLRWEAHPKHTFTLAVGRHSQMTHEAFFFVEGVNSDGETITANKTLDVIKSIHNVIGWEFKIREHFRIKTEIYYQYLYNVPVADSEANVLALVNSSSVWNLIGPEKWFNTGTAKNYGLDLTIQKSFAQQYYLLGSASFSKSRFMNFENEEYPSRFDHRYRMSLAVGKEFKLGKSNRDVLSMNARTALEGGLPFTPIDLVNSKRLGTTVLDYDRTYDDRLRPFWRFDIGLSLQLNRGSKTHTFRLDIQNLTNYNNELGRYYDPLLDQVLSIQSNSFFPILNYRMDF